MTTRTAAVGPRGTDKKVGRIARLQWVPLARMRVNPLAQRDMRMHWVNDLVEDFDPERLGSPTVNHTSDGWYNIVDGQHRIEALKLWLGEGKWEDQSIQCWTYEGLSTAQEADIFLDLNNVLAVATYAKFRNAVRAGRPEAVAIDKVVRNEGLVISQDGRVPGAVSAVGTLQKVYRRSDGRILGTALRIIRDAYGDEGLSAAVIDGLSLFCQRYDTEVDIDVAIERLARAHGKLSGLLTKAEVLRRSTGNQKGICVAAATVEIVKTGRGGRRLAPWWRDTKATS